MRKRILITGGTGFLGRHLALAMKDSHEIVLSGRNNKMIGADLEPEADHQPVEEGDHEQHDTGSADSGESEEAGRGEHR